MNLLIYTLQQHKDPKRSKDRRWVFSLITQQYIVIWYEVSTENVDALNRVMGILKTYMPIESQKVLRADNPVYTSRLKIAPDQFIVIPASKSKPRNVNEILHELAGDRKVRFTLMRKPEE